jgi:hypothetical protein
MVKFNKRAGKKRYCKGTSVVLPCLSRAIHVNKTPRAVLVFSTSHPVCWRLAIDHLDAHRPSKSFIDTLFFFIVSIIVFLPLSLSLIHPPNPLCRQKASSFTT